MARNREAHLGIIALLAVVACAPAPTASVDAPPGAGGRAAASGGAPGSGGTGARPAASGGGMGGAVASGGDGTRAGTSGDHAAGHGGDQSDRGGSAGIDGIGGMAAAASSGAAAGSGGVGGATPSASPALPVPPGPANVPRPSGTPTTITVVDWAGFKGAVSYTFDDSNSSQIQHYAELQALGVPCTFYMWTARPAASDPIWATVLKDGHEIGNHSKMHVSNGTGEDLDAATEFIESKWGVVPWTMAAPNGAPIYTSLAKGRFFINRGTKNSIVLPNDKSDPFTLPCYYPPEGAAGTVLDEQVDSARTAGGWRIFLIHGFSGGTDNAFKPVPFKSFADDVKHTKALGDMWIGRVDMVGAYWVGQKVFSQSVTTMNGSEKTWKWSLPDHFPPGRLLRVSVSGGKLKQGGAELPWDSHGYYEIALDAGSVTLAP